MLCVGTWYGLLSTDQTAYPRTSPSAEVDCRSRLGQRKKFFISNQETRVWVLTLPDTSCQMLSKLLGFSGFRFPHPSNGENTRGGSSVSNAYHHLQKILVSRGWRGVGNGEMLDKGYRMAVMEEE